MEVLVKNSFFTRSGKLTDAEILKIQELLTKTNVPIRDIAKRFSCTDKAVREINTRTGARPDTKRRADNRFFYY
jgi:hypothetical protein